MDWAFEQAQTEPRGLGARRGRCGAGEKTIANVADERAVKVIYKHELPPVSLQGRELTADAPQISDDHLRRLYDTYLVARKRCGEPTDGISYDSVASRIRALDRRCVTQRYAFRCETRSLVRERS